MRSISILLNILAMAAISCSQRYDHSAQTEIDGIIFRVGLMHSHPYLAEYKRFLEIEHAGEIQRKEIFPDTGGYAWVAVVNNCGNLEIIDINGVQFSKELTPLISERKYWGRFDFDLQKIYRFIPASVDPIEPKSPE